MLSDVLRDPIDVVADVDDQDDAHNDATAEADGQDVNLLLHRRQQRSHVFFFMCFTMLTKDCLLHYNDM